MASLKTLLFGEENRIARRLTVLIIAFSSLITLLISAAQLAFEYRDLRNGMEHTLDDAGIFVPSLSDSVWNFDETQVRLALNALKQLPTVDRVSISTPDNVKRWSSEKSLSAHVVTRTYPLRQSVRGVDTEIGTLEVVASLDSIYRHVADRAMSIVLGNGLKTLIVALFMLFLFRSLVTSRLEQLSRKVGEMGTKLFPVKGVHHERLTLPARLDELDEVGWTLDKTTDELKRMHEEIRKLNEELEARVKERTAQLEAANGDLESFGYSVSHDLRAPLRAIDGYAAIIDQNYAEVLGEDGRQLFRNVRNNAQKMGQLIDDILAFSRVRQSDLHATRLDMGSLVREAWQELEPQRRGRDIELRLSDLPAAWGDAAAMRQVWQNLLANAIKFTRGCTTAIIEVGGEAAGAENVYCTKDNGAGFDPAYASELFKLFHRLHGMEEFEGTGVGLSIVKRFVVKHGGRVWAQGQRGAGASFYFSLPRTSGEERQKA